MGAPYGQDLRDRVLAAYDRGLQTKQVADQLDVSPAWARRVKQCRREEGRITPKPMGGLRVVKVDLARLAELVEQRPDATLRELRQMLGGICAESTICDALKRLKLTFKKRQFMLRSRTAPMSRSDAATGKKINPRSRARG